MKDKEEKQRRKEEEQQKILALSTLGGFNLDAYILLPFVRCVAVWRLFPQLKCFMFLIFFLGVKTPLILGSV